MACSLLGFQIIANDEYRPTGIAFTDVFTRMFSL